MALGRPRRKKVNIMDLLNYIDQLPEDDYIKLNLTTDKMITINKYIDELKFLEGAIKSLKVDVKKNGYIEVYKNGIQETRRTNPAYTSYLTTIKTYSNLFQIVVEVLRNTFIDIQKNYF